MKILLLFIASIFLLSACQKETGVLPAITPKSSSVVGTIKVNQDTVVKAPQDTMPKGASFKIQLYKDAINNDDTMILFKQESALGYDPNEDGLYFQGNGQENLGSFSGDGRELAINTLPYTPGMSIGLFLTAKSDGAYSLKIDYQKNLPATTQIWLKDAYLKDSVNVRAKNYQFNIIKADTSSYGTQRFKLVIRNIAQ